MRNEYLCLYGLKIGLQEHILEEQDLLFPFPVLEPLLETLEALAPRVPSFPLRLPDLLLDRLLLFRRLLPRDSVLELLEVHLGDLSFAFL